MVPAPTPASSATDGTDVPWKPRSAKSRSAACRIASRLSAPLMGHLKLNTVTSRGMNIHSAPGRSSNFFDDVADGDEARDDHATMDAAHPALPVGRMVDPEQGVHAVAIEELLASGVRGL